jgi:glutaredoxin
MPEVILYQQTACASCTQIERFLRDRGIPFTAKDIGADAEAMRAFLELGYLTTPVTLIDGTPVPGFQPKRLAQLLERRSTPEDTR